MGGLKHSISQKLPKSLRPKALLRRAKLLKTWQLLLILLPLLFLIATLLRFNHVRMTELRSAVLAADESGDDEAIKSALTDLADFTFHHIIVNIVEKNGVEQITFGTGPFYLENQYRRHATAALEAAQSAAGNDDNPNGNVFSKAMDVCKPRAIAGGWAWNSQPYMDCMLTEIAKYPTADTIDSPTPAVLPATSAYRLNYASPVWTFSPLGLLILLALLLTLIILIRCLIWAILHLALFFLKIRKTP